MRSQAEIDGSFFPDRAWRVARIAAFCSIVLIAGLPRFADLGDDSLWHDEAWVAVSIEQPTVSQMLFESSWPQTTPPLFLIAVRALTSVFGPRDDVLRLPAAIAGLACIVAMIPFARRLTRSDAAAFFATVIIATNLVFFRYSRELKQYTTEALVTIVLVGFAERLAAAREERARDWISFTLVAALCVGLSFSAPLVIAMIGVRLAWRAVTSHENRTAKLAWTIGFGLVSACVGLAVYEVFVVPERRYFVFQHWQLRGFFPVVRTSPAAVFEYLARQTLSIPTYLFDNGLRGWARWIAPACGSLLVLYGWITFLRRREYATLFYTTAPLVILATLGLLKIYPYGGARVMLFAAPLVFVAAGAGVAAMVIAVSSHRRPVLAVTALLCVLGLGWPLYTGAAEHFRDARVNIDVRSATARYLEARSDGDLLVTHDGAHYVALHYAGLDALDGSESISGWTLEKLPLAMQEVEHVFDVQAAGRRVWLMVPRVLIDEQVADGITAHALSRCGRTGTWHYENADLYLLDCTHVRPSPDAVIDSASGDATTAHAR